MEVVGFIVALQPIVTSIGRPVLTFLKARSEVEKGCEAYNDGWDSAHIWLKISENLRKSLNQNEKELLEKWERKVRTANAAYHAIVTKHGRRVKVDIECVEPLLEGTEPSEAKSGYQSGESGAVAILPSRPCAARSSDHKRSVLYGSKRFAVLGRIAFTISGKSGIKKCEALQKSVVLQLKFFCEALQAYSQSDYIPPKISGTPFSSVLFRFVAQAKNRVRNHATVPCLTDNEVDTYRFENSVLVDRKMSSTRMAEYKVRTVNIRPREGQQHLPSYHNCFIVDCRGDMNRPFEQSIEDGLRLATFFLYDPLDSSDEGFYAEPDDGDMLRCQLVVSKTRMEMLWLIFKAPPSRNPIPRTLRQLLVDETPRCHPLYDRVKFAIRLATAVLVVHSLGFVHKRVHPEAILVFETLPMNEQQVYPHRLGYPYLAAFQFVRLHEQATQMTALRAAYEHHSVYFHPRDQGARRLDQYRMKDDIYSLGVCLFEIALWKSLLTWSKEERDYVYDDYFVPLCDDKDAWNDLPSEVKAMRRSDRLIAAASSEIPKVVDGDFAEVVISCLRAGYDDSPLWGDPLLNTDSADPSTKRTAIRYLELVLFKLHVIYDRYKRENK